MIKNQFKIMPKEKADNLFWQGVKNLNITETESLNTMIEELNRNTIKDLTIISKGMTISGNIELKTAMKLSGVILGNVISNHDTEMNEDARVEGDVQSRSLTLTFGSITGNVQCEEDIKTLGPTVINGNLQAKNIDLSGQVEGKIVATHKVKLSKTAVVQGDIIASSIEVEPGALIEGQLFIQGLTQNTQDVIDSTIID